MKLVSAHIKNVRLHKDLKIEFDEKLTLVGGPNESGKSTIAEAIHKCLFLKADSDTVEQRDLFSKDDKNEAPQVALIFEVNGKSFKLEKRFINKSYTRLTLPDNSILSGGAAEEKLAELLKTETAIKKTKEYKAQWSHLWIWQGSSSTEPWQYAETYRADLITGLKSQGAAAISQTKLDMEIATYFNKRLPELIVNNGKPKAKSDWDFLEKQMNDKKRILEEEAKRVSALIDSASELDKLVPELQDLNKNLSDSETELEQLQEKERKVEKLTSELRTQIDKVAQAEEKYKELVEADNEIRNTLRQIIKLQESIDPLKDELQKISILLEEKDKELTNKEKERDSADHNLTKLRSQFNYYNALKELINTEKAVKELTETNNLINDAKTKKQNILNELSGILDIDAKKLEQIEKLQIKIGEAQAVVTSIATGIKLVEDSGNVTLNGNNIRLRQSEIITEKSTIQVGKGTIFEISPGGGTSLQEKKEERNKFQSQLNKLLVDFGVTDYQQALDCKQRRDLLNQRLEKMDQRLEDLDSDNKPTQLEEKNMELSQVLVRINNLKTNLGITNNDEATFKNSIDQFVSQSSHAILDAEKEFGITSSLIKSLREDINKLRKRNENQKDELRIKEKDQTQLQGRVNLLSEENGDDQSRKEAISNAVERKEAEQKKYTEIQTMINQLSPEALGTQLERAKRVIQRTKESLATKNTRKSELDYILSADGSSDPRETYEKALNDYQNVENQCKIAERSAKAVALLDTLFKTEQQEMSKTFTAPLAEKVVAYLQFIFPGRTAVEITDKDNKFQGLTISRENILERTPLGFQELSGGAREQVAVAMRLAMAEVLATEHGGCLPVVLDDAFTNSDSERIKSLQNMLDYAAYQRGLQIIVLSCNPKDYDNLGAKKVELRPIA